MAEIIFFERHHVAKILETSAAFVFVHMHPDAGVLGLEDLRERFPQVIPLKVGAQLTPPAPVYMYDDVFVAELTFNGILRQVIVPWGAVLRARPENPPTDGGGGEPAVVLARAAA